MKSITLTKENSIDWICEEGVQFFLPTVPSNFTIHASTRPFRGAKRFIIKLNDPSWATKGRWLDNKQRWRTLLNVLTAFFVSAGCKTYIYVRIDDASTPDPAHGME